MIRSYVFTGEKSRNQYIQALIQRLNEEILFLFIDIEAIEGDGLENVPWELGLFYFDKFPSA